MPSFDGIDAEARRRVGAIIREKWHLDRLLGVGGMAAVYAATHRNGKRAALKILHAEFSLDVSIRTRFAREDYVANQVTHPGAVSVLDDDVTEDGAPYLVMELLGGESLQEVWERQQWKLRAKQVLPIVDQLLDVLAAAHDRGIVHRDIKPDNIFVVRDGTIRVLDFGIAHLAGTMKGGTTKPGMPMGTPSFMSPEQARGDWDEVGPRSDLWSVGATMFALLTGRVVHSASSSEERLILAQTTPVPPAVSAMPDTPAVVHALVDRALAFAKERRWSDARAMQSALRDACRTLGPIHRHLVA